MNVTFTVISRHPSVSRRQRRNIAVTACSATDQVDTSGTLWRPANEAGTGLLSGRRASGGEAAALGLGLLVMSAPGADYAWAGLSPHWNDESSDATQPLDHRLRHFYRQYATAIFTYEWMRIFMWAGLAGRRIGAETTGRTATPGRAEKMGEQACNSRARQFW